MLEFSRTYKTATYNCRVAEMCPSHLCSPVFSQGLQRDATWYSPGSFGTILQKHPFLVFACSKWATGIKKSFGPETNLSLEISHIKVLNLLKTLFHSDEKGQRKGNSNLSFQVYLLNIDMRMSTRIYHIYILSYFGLFCLFNFFKEELWFDLKIADMDGSRPIH